MSSVLLKTRPSAVHQILHKHEEEQISDDADDINNDAHREVRSISRKATMLDVRLANGSIESFNYAYLTRIIYNPGDTLVLRFGKDEIKLEGRRLGRMRERIAEHRTRSIQEGTEAEEGLKAEDAPHIECIMITEIPEQW